MALETDQLAEEFDPRFKVFHELMAKKVREILLVSTPYDAWIMEEDCRLSERIIHEYRGLNLSHPPRLTWVSTAEEALTALDKKEFDLVLTMLHLADMNAFVLGQEIKKKAPELPVILLTHNVMPLTSLECSPGYTNPPGIDRTFVWSGDTDILVALVKSAEDQMNAAHDTQSAGIRVILFVEDSPAYISSLLPVLYRELVSQTQAVLEEGLNEEHRLLTMRARPKILVAENYEEAVRLYDKFEPYVLGVISDVRFPCDCELDDNAGVRFLSRIKEERFDIPLLLTSSEASNAAKAATIPAFFVDKNSPSLHAEVRAFFLDQLGFGDFVFRQPDGQEIARASNMRSLEKILHKIPEDAFAYHCSRNDFSRWFFARTEIVLASKVRPIRDTDFSSVENHRQYLISIIHARRRRRQKGVVVNFDAAEFDLDTEFFKIGKGSLGGKARGLAFVSSLLQRAPKIPKKFEHININVPQTLAITTEGFDAFIEANNLRTLSKTDSPDEEVAAAFLKAAFPEGLADDLRAYLAEIKYPLAIRSSSLLEDAQFRAYAGLYRTYMLPNDHPDLEKRLEHLIEAIKLVYASTYFQSPKAFSRRFGHRTEEEKMAVIIQQLVGKKISGHFYPDISGVAQSYNYYPFAQMKPEDGIATIALGLGKTVMEGEKALRFSPRYPQLLPQRSTVEDILENSQQYFYALKVGDREPRLDGIEDTNLVKWEVSEAAEEPALRLLASTYIPEEHRIRDTAHTGGYPVLTFSQVLKYERFPLAELLSEILALGQEGMGCPVELEFSVNLGLERDGRPEFAFLQLRPMTARAELVQVDISAEEVARAFCFSSHALGNAEKNDIADILYVKPDVFDPRRTPDIAREIGRLNSDLVRQERKYLLIGPGRWGSADRWLGIPVRWSEICGVGAMVETTSAKLKADPSQGSHFFHNITSLGITYVTLADGNSDFLDWDWLTSLPVARETAFVRHVQLHQAFVLKVDGRNSHCVMFTG
ncbi:MAG: phosphoenolpyruvate synthase/pyruvate phosphate dikinase [Desulfobacterales bacterium]|nr:MAG: phosphoenolpyruvate synthase/pyruvate phosphate dikinase [Desulfobacterales bacterium]